MHFLSVERVKSSELSTEVGLKQLSSFLEEDSFMGCFCVNVAEKVIILHTVKKFEYIKNYKLKLRFRNHEMILVHAMCEFF